MAKHVAVILSGSGVYDGSEIHEAVLTLLALQKQGAAVQCFAPNVEQMHVINHLNGDVMEETRNVLVESARIARGNVKDLAEFQVRDFDALIFPGGFGAAKNLSSFAIDGADCTVNKDVTKAVVDTSAAGKVIGAMCIAPVILAKLVPGTSLTVGAAGDASQATEAMGATHTVTTHAEVIVDDEKKIVTTPCYMLDADIAQIEQGAAALVKAVLRMC